MGSSDYVFVRLDAETFEARPVSVGRFNGSRYEIQEGLELDEEVAVQGVFLLKSALLRGEEG
jgi:multidrug efflux pump subunit AcrA (membrane-fusion protein)